MTTVGRTGEHLGGGGAEPVGGAKHTCLLSLPGHLISIICVAMLLPGLGSQRPLLAATDPPRGGGGGGQQH